MKKFSKSEIIKYVLIFSIILYIGGIYTGININKILNIEIENEIEDVKSFLDTSSIDIKNTILSDYYSLNFEHNKCELQNIQLNNLMKELPTFWSQLPNRLEDYESTQEKTNEYLSIKREYFRYSLRLWLLSTNYNLNCKDDKIIPLLYFYKNNCPGCVEFIKEIEELKNKNILIFPIEGGFNDDTIYSISQLYNITSYPSIIYNYEKFENSKELIKIIER